MGISEHKIPYATSLDEVYPSNQLDSLRQRWNTLLQKFEQHYERKPDFVARSPGRVNLIGEHIDYSLYNVLPMAVTADVIIAVRAVPVSGSGASVSINNTDGLKFVGQVIALDQQAEITIDASKHLWTNYFMAGLIGAVGLLKKKFPEFQLNQMQVLVDGNIPPGGGLSSSAAFVCASALAVMEAHKYQATQNELLELAIVSERLVGVHSGGLVVNPGQMAFFANSRSMDQAASVLSKPGAALHVSFYPKTSFEHISFPTSEPHIVFLIAQSFVTADKHVTAPKHYNLRVVECALAAAVLAAINSVEIVQDASPLGVSLRGFQDSLTKSPQALREKSLDVQLQELIAITEKRLDKVDGYTREEVASILGLTLPELESRFTNRFPIQAEKFMLRQRALHVFSEALRVQQFINVLSSHGAQTDTIDRLGNLMNETQESCRDLYDCSCPELDELCRIARAVGAKGSRLTGAGWGGCTVHLVPADKVDDVVKALKGQYYSKLGEQALKDGLVVSEPGTGSYLLSADAR